MSSIAKICSVEKCERVSEVKKGWCLMHYKRWKRHGNPNTLTKILEYHDMTGTVEYVTWKAIKSRCYYKRNKRYADYGGRGITVCERWRNSFSAFYEDMGKRPSSNHSINRVNNDGNYEPNNCEWATYEQQILNRRINRRNTSGYRGVNYRKDREKWVSSVRVNNKTYYLGNFINPIEAAFVRDSAMIQIYGHNCKLNFEH